MPGDETPPEFVTDSIRQLESNRVQYILWAPRLNVPALADHPEGYHLAPFRSYMAQHYRLVEVFPDQDEIWERK